MNALITNQSAAQPTVLPVSGRVAEATPFSQRYLLITRQEHIAQRCRIAFLEAQHARANKTIDALRAELLLKDALIKDLQNRLFGKKTEKNTSPGSESNQGPSSGRSKGQQPGSPGPSRTPRPNLPVSNGVIDLPEGDKQCPTCGLPYHRREALDETSDVIEVPVAAHIRRYHRLAYISHEGCRCPDRPSIIIAPPPPKLIPRSPFGVSFWIWIILGKYHYAQPIHRLLEDLRDQFLPVSPGTVTGGLQAIAPLFEPIMEALYCRQMTEKVFHNDETRWPVFVHVEGKQGTRWVQQSAEFQSRQRDLRDSLQSTHNEATRLAKPDTSENEDKRSAKTASVSLAQRVAHEQQGKIAQSMLNHWPGLSLFLTHPEVPMDNNLGENSLRGPAVGRKNYYGSGSIWSAELAATLFSILQTLELWGIPLRHWLTTYLQACAENGGKAPSNIDAFLPWSLADTPIAKRPKPHPARPPPVLVQEET